ncbi:DUF4097 family beta strand repeat-containing protein [Brevibacillus migulae]|uniref:DUF4097 family beta strand repeat-containing protein n=1 Tax=Brevibacillus migulae TaxID=1644114 RepID=UPI00106DFA94|nr:DUF4097 family beta strand repeat-containing protein [Brevibacillus migulae]
MKGLLKKVAILAFLSFLVGVGGLIYLFVRYQSFPTEHKVIQEHKTIEAKDITRVEIDTVTADVRVTKSSTEQIEVSLNGEVMHNDIGLTVEPVGPGQLRILVSESEQFPFSFGRRQLDLEIALPDKAYQELRLQTNTGDFESLLPLQVDQMELTTDTGDLRLKGYTGNQLQASSETGDMDLAQVKGAISLRTATGDINDLELLELAQDVTIETSTGDVTVKLRTVPKAAQVELESDTGEVRTELPDLTFEKNEEKEIRAAIGTGGPIIKVQSATGDLLITN